MQDSGTEGSERPGFAARSSGTMLVEVKNFGIGESYGGLTLLAKDLGG